MCIRGRWLMLLWVACLVAPVSAMAAARCRTEMLEATVQAGAGYTAEIGGGLKIRLDPVANGWRLRVVPATGGSTSPDYAEIATPPYQSPSPLLLATEFQFRAQDVLGWNPRHFQYVADAVSYHRMVVLYGELQQANKAGQDKADQNNVNQSEAATRLAEMVSHAAAGEIEVLDARLLPGIANQSAAAAAVATHWGQTAHTTEQATDGRATALGRITWLKLRVRLDIPPGLNLAKAGGKLAWGPCL